MKHPDADYLPIETLNFEEFGKMRTVLRRQGKTLRLFDREDDPLKVPLETPAIPFVLAMVEDQPDLDLIWPVYRYFGETSYNPIDEPSIPVDEVDRGSTTKESDFKKWIDRNQDPNDSVIMRLISLHIQEKLDDFIDIVGPRGLDILERIIVRKTSLGSDSAGESLEDSFFVLFSQSGVGGVRWYPDLSHGTSSLSD